MSKFWYSDKNAATSGAPKIITIQVGALDAMFLLGALEVLTIPENFSIDKDVDLGGMTEEEVCAEIAEYWEHLIQDAFDNWSDP